MPRLFKAYILYRFAGDNPVYNCWLEQLPAPWTIVDDYAPEWVVPDDAGIVITHAHYGWEDLSALRGLYQSNSVPVLILSDGILEYRNTWQHPQFPDGAMFQPLFGHKIACLGQAPARILESWGNVGKCEVVGLPRLDRYFEVEPPPIHRTGPFRLLVATAKTPAFDEPQLAKTVASLQAIKERIDTPTCLAGRPIEVTWRLTGSVAAQLDLPVIEFRNQPPIMEQIDQSDAVVTTPSTIYLESVVRQRPTALLDFHHCPQYVPSAWTITDVSQIEPVLDELAHPPAAKMLFQSSMLSDQLACQGPATERLIGLIMAMIDHQRQRLEQGRGLTLPTRILVDEQAGLTSVSNDFDLAQLFPANPTFQIQSLQRLQIELSAALKRLDSLPVELAERQQHVAKVNRLLEQAKLRNRDLHMRLTQTEEELKMLQRRVK